jgi:hypothetical protein
MNPDTSDRQSRAVQLILVIVGIVLAIVGWVRWIF